MDMQRIAVSTDFSDESRKAFPAAAALAKEFGAELLVIHIPETAPGDPDWRKGIPSSNLDDIWSPFEKRLSDLVSSDPSLQDSTCRPRLIRAGTLEAYVEALAEERVDLLVMSTHGHAGFKRLMLGSFVDKVLRVAPCPVLVYRQASDEKRICPEKVLVPTDFSANNGPALRLAARWAKTFEAKTRLLHVIEHDPGLLGYAEDAFAGWYAYQTQLEDESRERFQKILSEKWDGLSSDTRIRVGNPSAEIVAEMDDFEPDLVVVGTHGRTGLDRVILGSVADFTIRKAPCPVLVVRGFEVDD